MTVVTHFCDMHSGGGLKEAPYSHIYIEAPEEEAKIIFYNRFGHDPERVSCTCCGQDYSITEESNLQEATAFDRNAAPVYFYKDTGEEACNGSMGLRNVEYDKEIKAWTHKGREVYYGYAERADLGHMEYGKSKESCEARFMSLKDYLATDEVLIIPIESISKADRKGSIPTSGWVWVD